MGKDKGEAAAVAAAMWYSCSLAAAAWPEKRDSRRGDAHVARGTPRKTERNTERPKRLKLNVKWHLAAIRNTQIAIRNRGIVVTQCGSKIRKMLKTTQLLNTLRMAYLTLMLFTQWFTAA